VGRRIGEEIAGLGRSIEEARALDLSRLSEALERSAALTSVFIGSGGAVALAQFGASLVARRSGVALVETPLQFVSHGPRAETGAYLFTASGRHPDSAATVRMLANFPFGAAVVNSPVPSFVELCDRLGVTLINLGNPAGKDGFLATNSLITSAVALARVFSTDAIPRFPALEAQPLDLPVEARELTVLYPPGLEAVAADIETRLWETGLMSVQATDYRNFAHGRHFGLTQRSDLAVLAVIDKRFSTLAEATLALLPDEIPQVRLSSPFETPWREVDLFIASIRAVAALGEKRGVDIGRPRVPAFGRKLYRLGMNSNAVGRTLAPAVRFKLDAMGLGGVDGDFLKRLETQHRAWKRMLERQGFRAVVLDYDGTAVSTPGRFEMPSESIRDALTAILENGLRLGFASGRGGSLHEDLRKWMPEDYWARVSLALYNGAVNVGLDEEIPERAQASEAIVAAAERVAELPLARAFRITDRSYQLQVALHSDSVLGVPALARILADAVRRPPSLDLEVVCSAHSVDILPRASTKLSLLERVGHEGVLVIGDQGQAGGNDFALLGATEFSLSVDRCSTDATRCYRLTKQAGPMALEAYLRALSFEDGTAHFHWENG
jgi:hypothetical protein